MKKVILICSILFGLSCGGCKKFVQIDPPVTELVTASVFNNNATATAAQTVIYSKMVNNSESADMAIYLGLLSDELTNYIPSNLLYSSFYENSMAAALGYGPWDNAYNYIYQANAIVGAIQGSSSLNSGVVQQLSGEAEFIRAYWYFYLTNLYGDVPLVTTTNYTVGATIYRTTRSQVNQQIVSDLKDAKILLNPNYIDASDTTVTTTDRTRPNKWAASALLSRVYLYMGDYKDAVTEADSLINNPLYSLCPILNTVFLVNSPEAIWQLGIPQPSSINTPDGEDFILISAPGSTNCCSIAPQLLNSFESGDSRRTNWIDSFNTTTIPAKTYYYPYKYKVRVQTNVTEEVMVLRLAEQYLIRAEANANLGDSTDAINDLNMIRNRASLPNYDPIGNGPLLGAILHERQVEFFSEWGHRWLDLIRTNNANSVMSNVAPLKGGAWNTDGYQELFPIPQSERNVDVNLTQNPGY